MQIPELVIEQAEQDVCCPPADGGMFARESAQTQASVFKALADPVRIQLLTHLADSCCSTVCACHLPELLGISQPTLSHHLKKLTDSGLVHKEMRGRWAHFTLNPAGVADVARFVAALAH